MLTTHRVPKRIRFTILIAKAYLTAVADGNAKSKTAVMGNEAGGMFTLICRIGE